MPSGADFDPYTDPDPDPFPDPDAEAGTSRLMAAGARHHCPATAFGGSALGILLYICVCGGGGRVRGCP